ncbi:MULTISPECIES: AAA-associated domain-containing protein [unclassified Saccharibacter]|uniref:ABC transporter ATP-binding protein n=1 Tax=unclassified Saccharibacter TaxID=2648722 RepID=UPI001326529A|nr:MULTISPECIES: nitrate/sulfonate/bicarbonate ABC transporter ATP-binding protein [unclassified Saccharibacter]MXV35274.1 ATP-binding cassette domain-containing protein [Saccharibacter sp. EH611]MXV57878.1 ATP-binding cassette domain-containing protein [Saccharibacter sp. EH70]MXV65208.1 ATP-binding cassette domain-containing protein [Saccharibacter sp. EH60]
MSVLLSLQGCTHSFAKRHASPITILENITLTIREGEILGLVGRSGSGKSSLMEIMSGLLLPSQGRVLWRGETATKNDLSHVSAVLQDDTLFPWLTVRENILLALEAYSLSAARRKEIADDVIEIMDIDGYEGAFPRELSDALKQRTILARALAQQPELLLLDEPFLDLEMLSAENLRTDLIELWSENRLSPLKAMMLATHAIEEAVLMCDRILLFSSGPGRITHEIPVPFPHPRNRQSAEFRHFVDQIYILMTRRAPIISEADLPASPAHETLSSTEDDDTFIVLPDLSIELLVGLLETLETPPLCGRADLPDLAQRLQMTLDDLLPLGEILQLLDLAELEDGDLLLTTAGQTFTAGDADARRDIMRSALLHALPLLRAIRGALDERHSHTIDADYFRRQLEKNMSENYAHQTLNTAIAWARYASLFGYDEETDRFLLEADD